MIHIMGSPKFSVIISTLNSGSVLPRCLDSIMSQDYPSLELIVVDGGSSDDTLDILKKYRQYVAYWDSRPDNGIYDAWNRALSHVTGDWICFLGSDDWFWSPDVLSIAAGRLENISEAVRVVYGEVRVISPDGRLLLSAGKEWDRQRFLQQMSIPHQGVFHRQSLFKERGGFDITFRIAGDYELLLRELRKRDAFFLQGLVVAGMSQGGLSSNPDYALVTLREIFRARVKNEVGGIPLHLYFAYLKAIIRSVISLCLGERIARICTFLYRSAVGRGPRGNRNENSGH